MFLVIPTANAQKNKAKQNKKTLQILPKKAGKEEQRKKNHYKKKANDAFLYQW